MPITRRIHTAVLLAAAVAACSPSGESEVAASPSGATGGQATVTDDESQPNVVRIAVGSKDHSTLVAALKAADLVNSLANAGPFTVFAPTNAAFDKLPAGTVDDLLKPANKEKLAGVLTHHVTTSALDLSYFTDGQKVGMADGGSELITKKGSDTFIGGAKVIGSVRGSNGWVHVIDGVLVPSSK
jgi:uncharacterized surface protein with fasciclin (FAS1) repeats